MQLHTHSHTKTDIGDGQRVLSAIGGSLLVYYVTKKHKADSLLLLGGAYLLYRAVSGHCPISASWKTNHPRTHPENWPLFMRHLGNVDELDKVTSAWTLKMPGVGDIRWEANIVREEKDTELSLSSVPGTPIDVTAKINFAPTPGNATRVDVMLSYRAPMGVIGERVSRLLTPAFRERIESDIANFKHYIENAGKSDN